MVFLNLRQRTDSVQALLSVAPKKVSKQMAKWAAGLQVESIVLVEGVVAKSPEIIKSASIGDVELHISKVKAPNLRNQRVLSDTPQIFLISGLEGRLPFTVEDANRPEAEIETSEDAQYKRVGLDTRLNNRVVDLRVRVLRIHSYRRSLNFRDTRLDPNQPSCVQVAVCYRTPIPGILGFTGFH